MNTEDKIKATIKDVKSRRRYLQKEFPDVLDFYTTLSLVIEELEKCLVDWDVMKCFNCKKTISKKLTPITDNYLCKKCMKSCRIEK